MKKIIDFFKRHKIFGNILLIILTGCLLLWLTFFILKIYTHHGEKEAVPDVRGLSEEMAAQLLEGRNMQYGIVDSVYRRDAPKGCVVDQYPAAGALVKQDRRIYLTINAKSTQMIPLPAAKDMSLRQAKAQLEGAEFVIEKVTIQPSEYKDLVLDVYCEGRDVNEGDRLPIGSKLDVWVGSGELTTEPKSYTLEEFLSGAHEAEEKPAAIPTAAPGEDGIIIMEEEPKAPSGGSESFEEELVF